MRRWKFAALWLLLTTVSVVWAWPATATLTDAELTDLWGGRNTTWCSIENAPAACDGFDWHCEDHEPGPHSGAPCWPDNEGIYYWTPEACGGSNQGGGAACNSRLYYVRCVTHSVCRTITLSNGVRVCANDTSTHTNVWIGTDLENCRYITLVPEWEIDW